MRFSVAVGALGVGLLAAGTFRDAKACGGCFHTPQPAAQDPDVITDHRMIFRVSPQQTTLYDEIEFQGSPQSFAWVLPIHGPVIVGLSSDRVFSVLDSLTTTEVFAPQRPTCPTSSCSCAHDGDGEEDAGVAVGLGTGGGADAGVNVISQEVVGPYETVQLQSTDPTALETWLTTNGYAIPSDVAPVVAAYVNEGFDFLAMKLVPGVGVSAMRPVRVTSPGAGVSLPLRMVAAGTGATVGITLWVLGDGGYEPQNFPTFTISASELTWDWSTSSSNYTTVRAQKEAALDGAGWQIESSLGIAAYSVENLVLSYPADQDYEAIASADGGDAGDGGIAETATQVRMDDLAMLFPGNDQGSAIVTRLRADLSHAALATDLVLEASDSVDSLSNIYQLTQSVNAPACPPLAPCDCASGSSSSGASGCATAATDDGAGDAVPFLMGLLLVWIGGGRVRRGRR